THKELDLCIQSEVGSFFEREMPEYVFLAAAKAGGIWANSAYPAEFIYSNLAIQVNVIHSAYLYGVKKLLFLGSSCIYPKQAPQPMKEEYLLTGPLEPTNDAYAVAKIAGIKMCQAYNRQYGTNFISVMPTNLYGPGDNFDLETSHVLAALIRKFHEAKLLKEQQEDRGLRTEAKPSGKEPLSSDLQPPTVVVWGSGEPLRELLHVNDLADACLFLMNNYNNNEIINVGVGKDISIRELVELVREVVDFKGKVVFDKSKPDGTPRKLLDVSRLNAFGWKAEIGLKEGIEETYRWYLKNIDV
ncbi:MAG: GDP-L-fucose synthase family protein, partial [Thermodesulfobacteriota bacterium]